MRIPVLVQVAPHHHPTHVIEPRQVIGSIPGNDAAGDDPDIRWVFGRVVGVHCVNVVDRHTAIVPCGAPPCPASSTGHPPVPRAVASVR